MGRDTCTRSLWRSLSFLDGRYRAWSFMRETAGFDLTWSNISPWTFMPWDSGIAIEDYAQNWYLGDWPIRTMYVVLAAFLSMPLPGGIVIFAVGYVPRLVKFLECCRVLRYYGAPVKENIWDTSVYGNFDSLSAPKICVQPVAVSLKCLSESVPYWHIGSAVRVKEWVLGRFLVEIEKQRGVCFGQNVQYIGTGH